jgi:N6-L-threonylcarbamoyladenine synthase
MTILAIETSCDETAAAVVEDGKTVLSNVVASQALEHGKFGGVVPELASRRHCENILAVVKKALSDADTALDDIGVFAVTASPGLIGALLVGVSFAKGLAMSAGKPLVPVNHIAAHIASNYLSGAPPKPPFLCLVASGGHSHIISVEDYTSFSVIGRTSDDAAGEAFDKTARILGYPYPGGVYIDKAAQTGDPEAFKLPRPKSPTGLYDFSFSGLKTAVVNIVRGAERDGTEINKAALAASFQKTAAEILVGKTIAAAAAYGFKDVSIAGGVAANSSVRSLFREACENNGMKAHIPPLPLCGDNAAMVGAQAYYEYLAGKRADESLNASAVSNF